MQCGSDQLSKRHHDRDRITRQAEEPSLPDAPKGKGLARFDCNLPKVDLPKLGQGSGDKISIPHRHAPGGNDGICLLRCLQQCIFHSGRRIGHDTHVDAFDGWVLRESMDQITVAIMDLPIVQRLVNGTQFVARRKIGQLESARDGCLGEPGRSQ